MSSKQELGFNILSQFVKNNYIEAPHLINNKEVQLNSELNIDVHNRRIDNFIYETVLVVKYSGIYRPGHKEGELAIQEEEDITCFIGKVSYAFIVKINDSPEGEEVPIEDISYCLNVDVPYLIFPYVRHLVSFMTSSCGYPPLNMHPINFRESYSKNRLNLQEEQSDE